MTERAVLEDLLGKIEKATGPDTKLGDDVHVAFNLWPRRGDPGYPHNCAESIDAALALVGRVLPGSGYRIRFEYEGMGTWMYAAAVRGGHPDTWALHERSAPLAILSALLKAKLAETEATKTVLVPM